MKDRASAAVLGYMLDVSLCPHCTSLVTDTLRQVALGLHAATSTKREKSRTWNLLVRESINESIHKSHAVNDRCRGFH